MKSGSQEMSRVQRDDIISLNDDSGTIIKIENQRVDIGVSLIDEENSRNIDRDLFNIKKESESFSQSYFSNRGSYCRENLAQSWLTDSKSFLNKKREHRLKRLSCRRIVWYHYCKNILTRSRCIHISCKV
jgi:hypothetical protein